MEESPYQHHQQQPENMDAPSSVEYGAYDGVESIHVDKNEDTSNTDSSASDHEADDIEAFRNLTLEERERQLQKLYASDEEDGDEEGALSKHAIQQEPHTKNETVALPPMEPRPITMLPVDVRLIFIGYVSSVIENTAVVASDTSQHAVALDEGSTLVLSESRIVLGEIFEVFGPVRKPFYSIRFSSAQEVEEYQIQVGMRVSYLPEKSKLINPSAIVHKGSDASNIWDEEPQDSELEFSDDEQEHAHKEQKKQQRRQTRQPSLPRQPMAVVVQEHSTLYEPLQRPPTDWNPPY